MSRADVIGTMGVNWVRGAETAASLLEDLGFNGTTTHPYRLDDCILGKLNIGRARPRRNRQKIEDPKDAMVRGIALALGEVLRDWQADSQAAVAVAKGAGLTLAKFKAAGVDDFDLHALQKAGVK
jgi:hypothetical protein